MNRALRDLQWAITSPPLLVDDQPLTPELQTAIESFDPSSIDRAALETFLATVPTQRVGRYFERLVLYWLSRICGFQIVAHGYQVRDDQRTVGELDFLFRDSAGELHHWETAVKFYLHYSQPLTNGDRLIGPNPADTFEKKLVRMYQHQLPLSKRIFEEPVLRRAFVKGRIFYPWQAIAGHSLDTFPSRLAHSHLRGVWIRARQLDWFGHQPPLNRYTLLSKPYWLAPERLPASSGQCLSAAAMRALLRRHFDHDSQPRLCSVLAPHDEVYEETERLFVVSNDWPSRRAGSKHSEQQEQQESPDH